MSPKYSDYNILLCDSPDFDLEKYNDFETIFKKLEAYFVEKNYNTQTISNYFRGICQMLFKTDISSDIYINYSTYMDKLNRDTLIFRYNRKIEKQKQDVDVDVEKEYNKLCGALECGIEKTTNGSQRIIGNFFLMIESSLINLLKLDVSDLSSISLTTSIESFYYLDLQTCNFRVIYKDCDKLYEIEYKIPNWFCESVAEEHRAVKSKHAFKYMIGRKNSFEQYLNKNTSRIVNDFHKTFGITFMKAREIIKKYFDNFETEDDDITTHFTDLEI